jgi:glycosyltransferase involved in cell wall biosynthesis
VFLVVAARRAGDRLVFAGKKMKISVVIPTYRRPEMLARCLRAASGQSLGPEEFEILVADNAGDEAAREWVESSAQNSRLSIRYLNAARKPGPAFARNEGWRAARGEIVAFTDDDCVPDENWLAEGLKIFAANENAAAVTGKIEMPLPELPTDYELNESGLTTAEFVTANCFVRRAVLAGLGGFDERFTAAWREDSDLHFRLLAARLEIVRAPRAAVAHPIRPARFGVSVFQQKKSMFDALLYRKHPRLFREKIDFSPLAFYLISLSPVVSLWSFFNGQPFFAWPALAVWLSLTARFCLARLRRTSRAPAHLLEMILTSVLIPPLAVFWRLRGAWRFRVFFL